MCFALIVFLLSFTVKVLFLFLCVPCVGMWTVIVSFSGLEVIKLFSCSTQLSMKFIMLINVKMPTFVGILTFISIINTTSKTLKAITAFNFQYFCFYK